MIYGLSEESKEDNKSLQDRVQQQVFKDLLGVEVNSIERIHRVGFKRAGKHRPIMLRLFDYSEKTTIMSACFKLKGTQISISEDFSKRVRDLRRRLWHSAAVEKTNGAKVSLLFDKLKVDDKVYIWDELSNQRLEVTRRDAQARRNPGHSATTRVNKRSSSKK